MKHSIRRIGNALLGVGALGLFVSSLSAISYRCGAEGFGCLATVFGSFETVSYVTDLSQAETTDAFMAVGTGWAPYLALVSGNLLFIAVFVLIVLEVFELHYLRKMLRLRKHLRT